MVRRSGWRHVVSGGRAARRRRRRLLPLRQEREGDDELGPAPRVVAADGDVAAVEVDQLLRKREPEPEPEPASVPIDRVGALGERLEEPAADVGRDPDPACMCRTSFSDGSESVVKYSDRFPWRAARNSAAE